MKTKPKDNMKQLVARIPEEVHRALKIRAAEDGRSVAVIVEGLVRQYLTWKSEVGDKSFLKILNESSLVSEKGKRRKRSAHD